MSFDAACFNRFHGSSWFLRTFPPLVEGLWTLGQNQLGTVSLRRPCFYPGWGLILNFLPSMSPHILSLLYTPSYSPFDL